MLEKIIPPDEPEKIYRWRWAVFIALGLLLINAAAGRGLFPILPAYASEKALQEQSTKIDRLLKLQIASTLRDLRRQECTANGNRALIQRAIEDYQEDYKEINGGIRYPLPPCEVSNEN